MADRCKEEIPRYQISVMGLPYEYTWREVKDLVRNFEEHRKFKQPEDVKTDTSNITEPGNGRIGFLRVKSAQLARELFDDLTTKDLTGLLPKENIERLTFELWHNPEGGKPEMIYRRHAKHSFHHNTPNTAVPPSAPYATSSRLTAQGDTSAGQWGIPSASQGRFFAQQNFQSPFGVAGPGTPWTLANNPQWDNTGHFQYANWQSLQAYASNESAGQGAVSQVSNSHACKVHVGGLPTPFTKQNVCDHLQPAGNVADVKFEGDPQRGRPRSAVVEFETLHGAQEALRRFNGVPRKGLTLSLRPFAPNHGFPTTVKEEDTVIKEGTVIEEQREPTIAYGTNRRPEEHKD